MVEPLTRLEPDMPIVFGGDRIARVPRELADAFTEGDRLVVVQETGALLHIPRADWEEAATAVDRAHAAFSEMGPVKAEHLSAFYRSFASSLEDDDTFGQIAGANAEDVEDAKSRGRSTTRLVLDDQMRAGMIEGLRLWAEFDSGRGREVERVEHDGWTVSQVRAGLGIVGFVFEGRPNVLADATGVLASGNTVVFRIGSDALRTARAIMSNALVPALRDSGLPEGAVSIVDTTSRAAGWAMFSDPRLGLAVARGSGAAVSQLGAVARQTGIPVSLHGTGGAWVVAADSADPEAFAAAVYNSLDRKVCNTLNTVCIVASRAGELVPVFLDALDRAAEKVDAAPKLHVTEGAREFIPEERFDLAIVARPKGRVPEQMTEVISDQELGVEWEWDGSPEVTLTIVEDVESAVEQFNRQSPRFVASLISSDENEHQHFFDTIDAPFVGNGFTRWVDGQYAFDRPELGLSNWQFGRLFGRGGVLSGDSVYTIRTRAHLEDPDVSR